MKPLIAYIDDEPINLTVFELALEQQAWNILVYDNPIEAIESLKKQQPWVVITDQRMPLLNGVELLEKVKEFCPNAIRIITTAYSSESLVLDSVRRAHIFDYIRKPWEEEELITSISRAINVYHLNKERKDLHKNLKVRTEELEQAHKYLERLAAFPTHMPAIMMSFNASQEIIYSNPFAKRVFEILAINNTNYSKILPMDVTEIIKTCLHQKTPIFNLEKTYKKKTYLWNFSAITSQSIVHCYGIDITDKKAAEKKVHFAEIERKSAENANLQKSMFISNMSHEFRTPLNAIIGFSEMLAEEAENSKANELASDLHKIHSAGKHLLALVNNILDLAKIEAGKVDLHLEPIDFHSLIADVEAMTEPLVRRNNNVLVVSPVNDSQSMLADELKVRQTIFNLLSNACKFTTNGTIKLDISQQTINDQSWTYFTVTDTGIGMTEEQLSRVFNEFSQADFITAKKFGGTGLGLSISKRLCNMMGGDIHATSQLEKGSVFTVQLPTIVTKTENGTTSIAIESHDNSTNHSRIINGN